MSVDIPMAFYKFITKDKSNLRFLQVSIVITVIYFIILRILFPTASFYYDTDKYIDVASLGLKTGLRPLGYSYIMSFFHAISHSEGLLVFAQYITNVIANLFLFYTLLYFFPLKKFYKILFYVLLMVNPLYVIYSNYVLSDAFFCSFSVMWFTALLWIMYHPRWIYFFIQLILLYWLFLLRYNALSYPFIAAIAYLLSKQSVWKKIASIGITFLLIIGIVISLTYKTKEATGVATFSPFGGWNLANNAMWAMKHVNLDSTTFKTQTSKEICGLVKHYFDSVKVNNPNAVDSFTYYTKVNSIFMWVPTSPLWHYRTSYFQKYLDAHPQLRRECLGRKTTSWTSTGPKVEFINIEPAYEITSFTVMGPIYGEFGTEALEKYPLQYWRYFVWPNMKYYWHPSVEAYLQYNIAQDTLRRHAVSYYSFSTNKIDQSNADLLYAIMSPWSWLFTLINTLFVVLVGVYYNRDDYKSGAWFNRCLIFYVAFYVTNFLFNSFSATTYFRYHVFIVTLCTAFIIYLCQKVFTTTKEKINPVGKGKMNPGKVTTKKH